MQALQRIYDPFAYDVGAKVGSYWETTTPAAALLPALEGDLRAEVAVIGAGYTGLSAALHLARDHGMAPLVLDAGQPGWGASGRNAGFCGFGGAKLSDAEIVCRHGAADLAAFYRAQAEAIELVRRLTADHRIDVEPQDTGEYCLAHSRSAMAGLKETAGSFKRHVGLDCPLLSAGELRGEGMHGAGLHGGLLVPAGFGLNPRKYALGLAEAAMAAGARLHGDTTATGVTEESDGTYLIRTPRATIRASHLILASNGYSSDNLPAWMRGRYLPVASHIMVTRPLTEAERQAQGWTTRRIAYDSRNLLHYFRHLPDNRALFGMRGTSNITARSAAAMRQRIRRDFDALFPALNQAETEFHWSGLVCLARDLAPYIGRIGNWRRAWTGMAYHGGGVAMATYAGRLLAGLVAEEPCDSPLPRTMQGPLHRFPLSRLRRHLLPLAYGYFGLRDRFE